MFGFRQIGFLCSLAILNGWVTSAFAADDDIVIDPQATKIELNEDAVVGHRVRVAVRVVVVNGNDVRGRELRPVLVARDPSRKEQFERQVFPQDGNAQRGRWTINTEIANSINDLDRICQLTDTQKQKLELAGRVDRKRFFDLVADTRDKYVADPAATPDAEIQFLQSKVFKGILNSDSFFFKTLRFSLSEEQLAKLNEHRRSRHQNSIDAAMTEIARIVNLTESQHAAVSRLLLEVFPLPANLESLDLIKGNSGLLAVMYKLSLVSESELKPLLDPQQWETLQPRIAVYRQFETYLIKRELIVAAGNPEDGNRPQQKIKELK